MDVEQVTAPVATHGEGPVWSEIWGGLRFLDMLAGDVLAVSATAIHRSHVGGVVGAVRPRAGGGMVVSVERGFALVDQDGTIRRLPDLWWSDPTMRMNDGGCDPQGRFYCGTWLPSPDSGAGFLYRLDVDGTASPVFGDVIVSNGLAWSPDGLTAYYIDTQTRRVDVLDHDPETGIVGSSRRPLINCEEEPGLPDGMTVDAEGCLWVAFIGAGTVVRYTPDGRNDGRLSLPVTGVTACTFGGPDLGDLYMTTSRLDGSPDPSPEAGAVFRARPGVVGLRCTAFQG